MLQTRIRKYIYFNSLHLKADGSFLISPQTVSIKNATAKPTYSAKSIIEHYSATGVLEGTLNLPKIKGTAFEYRKILELSDGSLLINQRNIKVSKKAPGGRTFKNVLIKVKRKN